MKTLIITLLVALQTFCFAATADPALAAVGHCLAEQLTASTWTGDTGRQWTFTADGTLLLLDPTSRSLNECRWILTSDERLTLEVQADNATEHYYPAPHCDQESIVLKAANGKTVVLAPAGAGSKLPTALTGDWQKGFSNDEPFLTFKADGTYLTTDVNTDDYQLRTGQWSIVENTLLLRKADGEVQAYLIRHLQMDELVLSPFSEAREDWYLNKL